jgi:protein-disulfide isomerase
VRDTWPQIDKEYVEKGKLKFALLDFPLESIHKNAFKAAEATWCAKDQGKYWEMHERLFTNQQTLNPDDLVGHAKAIGLDEGGFKKCLDEGTYAAAVRKSMTEAQKAGVTGTPAFFLAVPEGKDGKVKTVQRLSGAQPFAAFQAAIDSALADTK